MSQFNLASFAGLPKDIAYSKGTSFPAEKASGRKRYYTQGGPPGPLPPTIKSGDAYNQNYVNCIYNLRNSAPFRSNLRQNQAMFINRKFDESKRASVANITDMNAILRRCYHIALNQIKSDSMVDSDLSTHDIRSAVFGLEERHLPYHPVMKNISDSVELKYVKRYFTAEGIMQTWAWLGPLVADTAVHQMTGLLSNNAPTVINALVKGDGEIEDLWGPEARPGSELYFILKRTKNCDTDTWGHFAFHPYVKTQAAIPRCDREYVDHSGVLAVGPAICVGRVHYSGPKFTPESIRKTILGLNEDPNSASVSGNSLYSQVQTLRVYFMPPPGQFHNVALPH